MLAEEVDMLIGVRNDYEIILFLKGINLGTNCLTKQLKFVLKELPMYYQVIGFIKKICKSFQIYLESLILKLKCQSMH